MVGMATVTLHDGTLAVRFTPVEKIAGLVRDFAVAATAVTEVRVEEDALAAARGIRAPGLGIPGRRKVGTWRGRSGASLVSVRRGQPALSVTLDGQRYRTVLVGADDAQRLADQLSS
jgi:hypothetical protein